jgi:hypothetical protein
MQKSAFNIIERYADYLLPNAKILMRTRIETSLDDTKNIIAQLSKSQRFQPEIYIPKEKNEVWIILSRIRQ